MNDVLRPFQEPTSTKVPPMRPRAKRAYQRPSSSENQPSIPRIAPSPLVVRETPLVGQALRVRPREPARTTIEARRLFAIPRPPTQIGASRPIKGIPGEALVPLERVERP